MHCMLMQIKQRVLEVVDEMTMVASRADESCAMVSSLAEEVQQREESRGQDREKHNVTEAMMRKGPEGQDGQEAMAKIAAITCRTLQEEWCPACHQDEAASAAVLAKCLSASTENSARSSRTRRL